MSKVSCMNVLVLPVTAASVRRNTRRWKSSVSGTCLSWRSRRRAFTSLVTGRGESVLITFMISSPVSQLISRSLWRLSSSPVKAVMLTSTRGTTLERAVTFLLPFLKTRA